MPIQTGRGRRSTQRPTRAQSPDSSCDAEPKRGHEGPEEAAAEDDQDRGQQRHHRDQGGDDADRADRAEPGGRVEVGGEQAEETDRDGRGRGEDGRPGLAQRDGHRRVLVLVAAQLLAVAGDQEQGVVGADAEDEHRQDAAALAVDGDPGVLGQQVDGGGRHLEGEPDRYERDQPEDRAAVGEQEQDRDDARGCQQQRAVDTVENAGEVADEAGGAGHLDLEAVAAVTDEGADFVDRVEGALGFVVGGGRHRQRVDDGPAVVGGDRFGRRRCREEAGERLAVGRDLGLVGRGQTAVAGVDQHRGQRFAVRELLLEFGDPERLGVAGQPGRGVVLLDLAEFAGERAKGGDDDQPDHEHEPLGAPAGDGGGESGDEATGCRRGAVRLDVLLNHRENSSQAIVSVLAPPRIVIS